MALSFIASCVHNIEMTTNPGIGFPCKEEIFYSSRQKIMVAQACMEQEIQQLKHTLMAHVFPNHEGKGSSVPHFPKETPAAGEEYNPISDEMILYIHSHHSWIYQALSALGNFIGQNRNFWKKITIEKINTEPALLLSDHAVIMALSIATSSSLVSYCIGWMIT